MTTTTAPGILGLIGNTPMVEVKGMNTGCCRLFMKLESQNPGASIKDRIAVSMIADAEARGILKPGGTLVEATAGNTGLGLALVAGIKGYKVILVMPDKMSREKILHLQALGAKVVLTRSDVGKGHPDYYQDKARALAESTPGAWYVDQFSNPANPLAHETGTGPEIWEQMNHDLGAVVLGVGSGGTLGGLSSFFSKVAPHVQMVIADPEGSVVAEFAKTGHVPTEVGAWFVEGIGEDFIPSIAQFSLVKAAYTISDRESFLTARELLKTNGLFGGSSSGTLVAAALRFCREQTNPMNVVTFLCDSGNKYLSKMYSDFWMSDHQFLPTSNFGDLRDLITRHADEGEVISVSSTDNLATAYSRMKSHDISQLPVLQDKHIVGIIDESDLLLALHADSRALKRPTKDFMSTKLETVTPSDSVERVLSLLKDGLVVIVQSTEEFLGIITRMDVVEYLRRTR